MSEEEVSSKFIYSGSYKIETDVLEQGLDKIKINEFKDK